jgi:hypothetical protein
MCHTFSPPPEALASSPEVAALMANERAIWTEAIETYFDATAVEDVEKYVATIRAARATP